MKYKPKDYQKVGIKFIVNNPATGLFADPGLGKTSIVLKALELLRVKNKINKILVIAPMLVCYNVWPQEIKKWGFYFDHQILHNHEIRNNADLYLINPESIKWFFDTIKQIPKNTALVIDESTRFKSSKAKRFKLLKKYLHQFRRRIILTGTPAPNSIEDLWSQIYILDLGKSLSPKITHFRDKYLILKNPRFWQYGERPGAQQEIEQRIAPIVCRFSAAEFSDLPELLYNYIRLELPPELQQQYNKLEKEFFAELRSESLLFGSAAAAYKACHQFCNGAVYRNRAESADFINVHAIKLDALQNLCNELHGKPLLVAYYFRHDLHRIRKHFGRSIPHIGRGTSKAAAAEHIVNWNNGQVPMLLVHPASVSHGLNLQHGGNDICFFSLLDNLENYEQLIRRIYRQGVTEQVRVHHLIMRSTVDIAILRRLKAKSQKQSALLDALQKYGKKKWSI